jgi:hypothetical protein
MNCPFDNVVVEIIMSYIKNESDTESLTLDYLIKSMCGVSNHKIGHWFVNKQWANCAKNYYLKPDNILKLPKNFFSANYIDKFVRFDIIDDKNYILIDNIDNVIKSMIKYNKLDTIKTLIQNHKFNDENENLLFKMCNMELIEIYINKYDINWYILIKHLSIEQIQQLHSKIINKQSNNFLSIYPFILETKFNDMLSNEFKLFKETVLFGKNISELIVKKFLDLYECDFELIDFELSIITKNNLLFDLLFENYSQENKNDLDLFALYAFYFDNKYALDKIITTMNTIHPILHDILLKSNYISLPQIDYSKKYQILYHPLKRTTYKSTNFMDFYNYYALECNPIIKLQMMIVNNENLTTVSNELDNFTHNDIKLIRNFLIKCAYGENRENTSIAIGLNYGLFSKENKMPNEYIEEIGKIACAVNNIYILKILFEAYQLELSNQIDIWKFEAIKWDNNEVLDYIVLWSRKSIDIEYLIYAFTIDCSTIIWTNILSSCSNLIDNNLLLILSSICDTENKLRLLHIIMKIPNLNINMDNYINKLENIPTFGNDIIKLLKYYKLITVDIPYYNINEMTSSKYVDIKDNDVSIDKFIKYFKPKDFLDSGLLKNNERMIKEYTRWNDKYTLPTISKSDSQHIVSMF